MGSRFLPRRTECCTSCPRRSRTMLSVSDAPISYRRTALSAMTREQSLAAGVSPQASENHPLPGGVGWVFSRLAPPGVSRSVRHYLAFRFTRIQASGVMNMRTRATASNMTPLWQHLQHLSAHLHVPPLAAVQGADRITSIHCERRWRQEHEQRPYSGVPL